MVGPIYIPKEDFSSKMPRVKGLKISAPTKKTIKNKTHSRTPTLLYPNIDKTSRIPNITVPRFVKSSMGIRETFISTTTSQSPGPIYNVDWDSLAKTLKSKPGARFGGLS